MKHTENENSKIDRVNRKCLTVFTVNKDYITLLLSIILLIAHQKQDSFRQNKISSHKMNFMIRKKVWIIDLKRPGSLLYRRFYHRSCKISWMFHSNWRIRSKCHLKIRLSRKEFRKRTASALGPTQLLPQKASLTPLESHRRPPRIPEVLCQLYKVSTK